ncbi:hypothetical protein K492DRAFT_175741 [Lichtheimia hyalospora FSU 10163]|nr:hypothetical protein K492DRAFT_175741 [Lichtheimia hyalospora FSU 10163]
MPSQETIQIFIKNVAMPISDDQLREAFNQFEFFKRVNIVQNRNCAYLDLQQLMLYIKRLKNAMLR